MILNEDSSVWSTVTWWRGKQTITKTKKHPKTQTMSSADVKFCCCHLREPFSVAYSAENKPPTLRWLNHQSTAGKNTEYIFRSGLKLRSELINCGRKMKSKIKFTFCSFPKASWEGRWSFQLTDWDKEKEKQISFLWVSMFFHISQWNFQRFLDVFNLFLFFKFV